MQTEGDNILTSQTNGETTGAELCPFPEEPLLLLDFGCKRRNKEERNSHPAVYRQDSCLQDRYLFLYTFHGTGICERKGNSHTLLPGTGFLSDCPWEESCYTSDESWEYLYICFEGPTARPFCGKILKDFGPVFSLPSDSMPIQLWMNLRKDQDRGRRLRPYEGGEMIYRFLSSLLRTLETFTPPPPPLSGPMLKPVFLT